MYNALKTRYLSSLSFPEEVSSWESLLLVFSHRDTLTVGFASAVPFAIEQVRLARRAR